MALVLLTWSDLFSFRKEKHTKSNMAILKLNLRNIKEIDTMEESTWASPEAIQWCRSFEYSERIGKLKYEFIFLIRVILESILNSECRDDQAFYNWAAKGFLCSGCFPKLASPLCFTRRSHLVSPLIVFLPRAFIACSGSHQTFTF